jgi:FKBP-type peptidyl-prolyl cis-trans isomerase
MKANEAKEGVRTLQSGLQYVILKEGSGPSPKETDTVRVNYRGTLIDGTEFDSSYEKGGSAVIPVAGVIKGWTEALQLMKAGSKWRIFVPEKLAYGQRQYGKIPPNSTLIFDLELLSLGDPLVPVLEEPQLSGK